MKIRHYFTSFGRIASSPNIKSGFVFPFILMMASYNFSYGADSHSFKIGKKDFLLDGKPIVIKSGELHFSRIPRAYWRHRLRMCKAMGLNTVCAYMFWNFHEPQKGEFNFSGRADVAEFCRIAQQEGLLVILRPGPYSCAEWDFGGFPYWLLQDETMKLRSRYSGYLQACKRYTQQVGRELKQLQITRGGPIIMVQVENEYGSFGDDKEYLGILRDDWREAGFEVPLFTCDGPVQLQNDVRDDLFCVVNFGSNPEKNFRPLRAIRPDGPLMCGEYYPGWFDHWGGDHHTGSTAKIKKDLTWMLDHRASFSIYMVHGGTSFGFTAGANYSDHYQPQTTSYDYDAPISEAGWATDKYLQIRHLLSSYLDEGETLPEIPAKNPVISTPDIALTYVESLFDNLGKPISSLRPKPMEFYDQGQGVILYRTRLKAGKTRTLHFEHLHDFALIFVNGKKVATFDRREHPGEWVTGFNEKGMNVIKGKNENFHGWDVALPAQTQEAVLDVLVEAMGHINYGAVMGDRKGIVGSVTVKTGSDSAELLNWHVYPMPLDKKQLAALSSGKSEGEAPAFYRATFELDKVGDTFLDMSRWGKGVVWVNGHNLGRYWHIGPSQTLYLPGPWLKQSENEIIILELVQVGERVVKGLKYPILNRVNKR